MAKKMSPKRTPRTPIPTNIARQLTHTVDFFEPNEPWVNVPGYTQPRAPSKQRNVWAPVRRRKYMSPLFRTCQAQTTGRKLDPWFKIARNV